MLAYTTVGSLGLLVHADRLRLGQGDRGGGALSVAHSLFKGALFMVAGLIDHETGTRDITRLGGLARAPCRSPSPPRCWPALSMAGLPLFFGFLAKEEIYAALGRRRDLARCFWRSSRSSATR